MYSLKILFLRRFPTYLWKPKSNVKITCLINVSYTCYYWSNTSHVWFIQSNISLVLYIPSVTFTAQHTCASYFSSSKELYGLLSSMAACDSKSESFLNLAHWELSDCIVERCKGGCPLVFSGGGLSSKFCVPNAICLIVSSCWVYLILCLLSVSTWESRLLFFSIAGISWSGTEAALDSTNYVNNFLFRFLIK